MPMTARLLIAAPLALLIMQPASSAEMKPDECGLASVYSSGSEATASGEDTEPANLTAAHRSLPFETMVRVDNQENGRSAIVRITDRGPFVSGRVIDLSQIAARELGISGLTKVCIDIISTPDAQTTDKN